MSLLPYWDTSGTIVDGTYFHLLPFCRKNCSSEKCKMYYEELKRVEGGSYCCPYGLSSYIYASPEGRVIFTGLRIKGSYNKKKAKVTETQEYVYNPVIDEVSCNIIAQEVSTLLWEKHKLEAEFETIRDLLHETRSLNSQIKNSIDLLWETNSDEHDIDYDTLIETLKKAHVSSFMISNRFSYFDSVLNPSLSVGSPYPAVIFKKFDKMRRLLKGYQRKNVWITIDSPIQSDFRYNIYPTFETLLFIILENAIKYSPSGKPVEVTFSEDAHILDVTIRSIGPYCDENELMHLCDKGFRSENAKIAQEVGQGFGLNFAQKICAAHKIGLTFNCTYSHKDHGIKYGTFSVCLHFDNSTYFNP